MSDDSYPAKILSYSMPACFGDGNKIVATGRCAGKEVQQPPASRSLDEVSSVETLTLRLCPCSKCRACASPLIAATSNWIRTCSCAVRLCRLQPDLISYSSLISSFVRKLECWAYLSTAPQSDEVMPSQGAFEKGLQWQRALKMLAASCLQLLVSTVKL